MPNNLRSNFTLKNCLFRAVRSTRNTIKSNFAESGLGIAFNGAGSWSFGYDFARNVKISGVDNTLSIHTDNSKNNFLVLDEVLVLGVILMITLVQRDKI